VRIGQTGRFQAAVISLPPRFVHEEETKSFRTFCEKSEIQLVFLVN